MCNCFCPPVSCAGQDLREWAGDHTRVYINEHFVWSLPLLIISCVFLNMEELQLESLCTFILIFRP